MPTVSGADLTTWRQSFYHHRDYLYIPSYNVSTGDNVVFEARVDQSAFDYPIASIDYDTVTTGAFGDIEAGQTVLVGSTQGDWDLGLFRARADYSSGSVATASTLYIAEAPEGHLPYGLGDISDNAYITVVDIRLPWPRLPRFDEVNFDLLIDYDIEFDNGSRNWGERPAPLANAGPWGIFIIGDSATEKTGVLVGYDEYGSGIGSFAIAGSKTSEVWDVQDGTITTGTSSDVQITCTFPRGWRYISRTVTNSNTDTHTAYTPIVVAREDDCITDFVLLSETHTQDGPRARVRVHQALPLDRYLPLSPVLLARREWFEGTEGTLNDNDGRGQTALVGYLGPEASRLLVGDGGSRQDVELDIISPFDAMRRMHGIAEIIENSDTPTDWSQYQNLDLGRATYAHTWRYTNLPELHDIAIDGGVSTTYDIVGFSFSEADLLSQIEQAQAAIPQRLTCTPRGRWWFRQYNNHVDQADRITTEILTLQQGDWIGEISLEGLGFNPRVYRALGGGVVQSRSAGTQEPVLCQWPAVGSASYGAQMVDYPEELVASQSELNARVGHKVAEQYRWVERITLTVRPGDIRLDACRFERVDIASMFGSEETLRKYASKLKTSYAYVVERTVQANGLQRISLIPETFGVPAETETITPADVPDVPEVVYTDPDDSVNPGTDISDALALVAVTDSKIGYTTDTDNLGVSSTYTEMYDIADFATGGTDPSFAGYWVDPFNPGTTAWVVTTEEYGGGPNRDVRVWKITDPYGTASEAQEYYSNGAASADWTELSFTLSDDIEGAWYLMTRDNRFVRKPAAADSVEENNLTAVGGRGVAVGTNAANKNSGQIYLATDDDVDYAGDLGDANSWSTRTAVNIALYMPWVAVQKFGNPSDLIVYFATAASTASPTNAFFRSDNASTATDITASFGGNPYNTYGWDGNPPDAVSVMPMWCSLATADVITCLFERGTLPRLALIAQSDDKGATWTKLADLTTIQSGPTSGDAHQAYVLTGWPYADNVFVYATAESDNGGIKLYNDGTISDVTGDWATAVAAWSNGISAVLVPPAAFT